MNIHTNFVRHIKTVPNVGMDEGVCVEFLSKHELVKSEQMIS